MLESIGKAIMIIGLGALFMASVYVLDQCNFTNHWNPFHSSCLQVSRAMGHSAVNGVGEYVTPNHEKRDFRRGLKVIREHADYAFAHAYDAAGSATGSANQWISKARSRATRWFKAEMGGWFHKI